MEGLDLIDHSKCPQFEPIQYLKSVYYEEAGVTRVELMKWATRIEHVSLLHMLYVLHFGHSIINTIFLCQLLALVHDGCLWLGEPILINEMMIKHSTTLPY